MRVEEFLEILISNLKWLKEEKKVLELTEKCRYDEVDVLLKEIDYSILKNYIESADFEELGHSDIPEEYLETYAIYLYGSKIEDIDVKLIWKWQEYQEALSKSGKIGKIIATKTETANLTAFDSFAKLMEE